MRLNVKHKRNDKLLNKLRNKITTLHNQQVEIGYFPEQGEHSLADMPYANLLAIHASGIVHPRREIFPHIRPLINGGVNQKMFFARLLQNYMQSDSYTANDILADVGKKYQQDGRNIFGNAGYLIVTNNPTPLIDTGELEKNFAYRTSITMQYVI